ncbi:MAG: ATP-dependent DNA helicase RecQ [Planctomycetes bacterium]|nr:ATP-dependent DNA helicase RecQ [Planctomycetota bacterium]
MVRVLRERFGLRELFPLQARIIPRVMAGGDALVVMPTGSGKSLCYQLPALALPAGGVTLVFSPLIALMEDQVAALKKKSIRAEYINSTLGREERERRYERLARGDYDLIYATPERMYKPQFVEALTRVAGGVKLLAIDEAHCVTKWGHDFRPAYQQVGDFRKQLGCPTTIALTATATPHVREDIRRTLGGDDASMPLFASGIDRPNLSFEVEGVLSDDEKLQRIIETAQACPGTGIVYFALIKDLERFSDDLRAERISSLKYEIYHGRLDAGEKKRVYDRFIDSPPDERLMLLATNAFGMGVDKPDIRYVVHAQLPGSVEAYYQEVGRAGRDGEPARCLLLYCQDDLAIQHQFIGWMNPSADLLMQASTALERLQHADFDVDELRDMIIHKNRGDRRAEYCLITLEKHDVIEPATRPERYRFVRPLRDDEIDPAALEEKKQADLKRLLDVVNLTKAEDIRGYLVDYFQLDDVRTD